MQTHRDRVRKVSIRSCLTSLALLIGMILPARATIPEYEFVDLTYNGETLIPHGISNDGTIVGTTTGIDRVGFVLRHGAISLVDIPGGWLEAITGINPSGTACVGVYWDPYSERDRSFEYRMDGSIHYLPDLGDAYASTVATDIADSGLIVGSYYTFHGHPDEPSIPFLVGEGFVMEGDTVRTYSAPGAGYTHIGGVNEAGRMVGHWRTPPPSVVNNPFVFEGGAFSAPPIPPSFHFFEFTDINNRGQVVGWGGLESGGGSGILLDGGEYAFIRYPSGSATRLTAINDSGIIVGYRYEPGLRGFIAIPKNAIPEPSSLALLLAGVPLVALRWRRPIV